MAKGGDGYHSQPLMCDVIYPVCTPQYLAQHPEVATLEGIRDSALLNLSPYGRSQVAEHVDWKVWFAYQEVDFAQRASHAPLLFSANDFNVLLHRPWPTRAWPWAGTTWSPRWWNKGCWYGR